MNIAYILMILAGTPFIVLLLDAGPFTSFAAVPSIVFYSCMWAGKVHRAMIVIVSVVAFCLAVTFSWDSVSEWVSLCVATVLLTFIIKEWREPVLIRHS